VNGEQRNARRSDIVQNVANGFQVVNFISLLRIQQIQAVAILIHSPTSFSICQRIFHYVCFLSFVFISEVPSGFSLDKWQYCKPRASCKGLFLRKFHAMLWHG
jgi:hypothetical protein